MHSQCRPRQAVSLLVNLISVLAFVFNKQFDSEETQQESVYSQHFNTTNMYFVDSSLRGGRRILCHYHLGCKCNSWLQEKLFLLRYYASSFQYIHWTLTGKGYNL